MSELTGAKRSAVEAVARHFSATWQSGDGLPDAYMTMAGRPIAVDIALMAQQDPIRNHAIRARLRDDAVVRRVLPEIERRLREHLPDGKTAIFTLDAPIREPKKMVAALTKMLLNHLKSGGEGIEKEETIHGNRVQFCISDDARHWNTKVTGFVFSDAPALGVLTNAIRTLHDEIAANAKKCLPDTFRGDRWLVLTSDHRIADIRTYQRICSRLSIPDTFKKILMLLDNGRVEALVDG